MREKVRIVSFYPARDFFDLQRSQTSTPAMRPTDLRGEWTVSSGSKVPCRPKATHKLFGVVAEGADHEPSSRRATITPAPPAPPKGAIPLRMLVKMTMPLACRMMAAGIFLMTFFCFFLPSAVFSSTVAPIPSTVKARNIRAHLSIS